MALTVQNLRAIGIGVEPAALLPGQIAFNVTDRVIYVGDGTSLKTSFDGTTAPGITGEGWYSMPMDLTNRYVANPEFYGDIPTDQQVLTWSDALNHPIWTSNIGGDNQVYVLTNNDVDVAPGVTTSAKITAAIGVVSPDEGDVTIVTGLPEDVYEGLYFFTTEWVKGAAYAYPSASEVAYNNVGRPALGATVQLAINDLNDDLIATAAIANTANSTANTANSTANSALGLASAALSRAGGTMTGSIIFAAGQVFPAPSIPNATYTTAGIVQLADTPVTYAGTSNTRAVTPNSLQDKVTDSVTTTDSNLIASATAVKASYDLAFAALPLAGGTMTGTLFSQNIQIGSGFSLLFTLPGAGGSIEGISDSTSLTFSNVAASTVAVKAAYDLADNALPKSGGTMTGDIIFNNGQPVDSGTY